MEIDVREEEEGKPDVIRYGDGNRTLSKMDSGSCVIGDVYEYQTEVSFEDVPNLIKALKKYQERSTFFTISTRVSA